MSEELKTKNENIEKELLSKVLRRMSDDFKNGNYDTEIVISLEELFWEEINFDLENLGDDDLLNLSKFSKFEEIEERAKSLISYRMNSDSSPYLHESIKGDINSPIIDEARKTLGEDWQEHLVSHDKEVLSLSRGMKL